MVSRTVDATTAAETAAAETDTAEAAADTSASAVEEAAHLVTPWVFTHKGLVLCAP